jgi:hypothetical protein
VHRGRVLGGNARKRKAKLTDATFHAMIGSPAPVGQAVVVTQEVEVVERVEADGIVFERSLAIDEALVDLAVRPLVSGGPASTEDRPFASQEFDFGYVECPTCHNDQAYYVRHADLAAGFPFRCRVCRSCMTAWAKA